MCTPRTMIKIAIGIGFLLLAGYFAFPQFQVAIANLAPYFLVLACPIAMYFGMREMNKNGKYSKSHHDSSQRPHRK